MMDNTTYKFLTSLGITNTDSFDIKFLKGKKENDVWIFNIEKETPWTYYLYDYFCEGLSKISYKAKIVFSYKCNIDIKTVVDLLKEYLSNSLHEDFSELVSFNKNEILISNTLKDKIKRNILDFRLLLDDLNYPQFVVSYGNISENIEDSLGNQEEQEEIEDIYDELDSQENEEREISDEELREFEDEVQKDIESRIKEAEEYQRKQKERLDKLFAGLKNPEDYTPCTLDEIFKENLKIVSFGKVFEVDAGKEVKNGAFKYKIGVHAGSSSYYLKLLTGKYIEKDFMKAVAVGTNLTFTGITRRDRFMNNEIYIQVDSMRIDDPTPLRDDPSEEKRVELHLHTNFSAMDGLPSIAAYAKLAAHMGMKAIAVTDHAVVQSFPAAQAAAKDNNIKMIYGCELYVVDDYFDLCFNANEKQIKNNTYVAFDLETSGLSPIFDDIIEFGAVKIKDGIIVDSIDILINPGYLISQATTNISNITNQMLKDGPMMKEALPQILDFIGDAVLVSHNLKFDFSFLNRESKRYGFGELKNEAIDTLNLSRYLNPDERAHNLGALCRRCEVFYEKEKAHRAIYDAEVLGLCWVTLLEKPIHLDISENGEFIGKPKALKECTFNEVGRLKKGKKHIIHSFEEHVIVLAKNRNSLKSLYKLVSLSHCEFFGRYPCVPKSELNKYRDDFIFGSACFNGLVFNQAAFGTREKLEKAVEYFDYIELQPLQNYSYLINVGQIKDTTRLLEILNLIIEVAQSKNKLICATGDAHYLNPDDKKFRDVYINAPGIGKTFHPLKAQRNDRVNNNFPSPDQHFRSTQEMLDCFKIFGEENAYNWVIKNTNIIADMTEEYEPIDEHLYTPVIENCDKLLVELCYENAHKLYGDVLPEIVETRLKKELDGIVGNGYYVTYYIAHKIIKKAHEDGFIVGSRGSVGSSFAATMADITEVNPLPPHYRCPKCRHFELYEGKDIFSGYDLPPKNCPECGEAMIGDGQNIPFETFLGFHAEKVPDIDLNFPPDYQADAHNYTKVLLGAENVFRAGTIGTASNKTAFGYARGYLERGGLLTSSTTNAEISYLSSGCINVKRTTGQHPGGIVVVPRGMEIYDFTPVQYPADDMDASWKTTHFEFESIHDTLLKLDLLGHVDPQALKMLIDLTGIQEKDIPFNDPAVISLFASPKALKLQHNYLKSVNGVLAIPEFGTEFVSNLVADTVPTTFAELLIISGLSHGTGVWRNNAESIIASKQGTLRDVIGCRDDIMTYLISKGIDSSIAFDTMEKVRKGKGLPISSETEMRKHGVPEFYIESCKKISYLFPKAHATAYVSNGIRVAWFKIYRPLEFYATFFSVRVDKFNWEAMRKGPEAIMKALDEMDKLKRDHPGDFTKTDEEVVKTLKVSLEMYDRGIVFSPIDLKESDSRMFKVDKEHNALIPPFSIVDGLGITNAIQIVEARKEKEFSSIEDVVKRGKINNTIKEVFKNLGIFKNLPEKENDVEQLSLFDF